MFHFTSSKPSQSGDSSEYLNLVLKWWWMQVLNRNWQKKSHQIINYTLSTIVICVTRKLKWDVFVLVILKYKVRMLPEKWATKANNNMNHAIFSLFCLKSMGLGDYIESQVLQNPSWRQSVPWSTSLHWRYRRRIRPSAR